MKVSDWIAEFLSRYTSHVFSGQGGCVVHLIDSIERHPNITLVPCENEQGASIAAEAYARVSGKLGVAIATSGPGACNLIQGIACAYFDSIPVLYITGQYVSKGLKGDSEVRQMGFQEIEVIEMVEPIAKEAFLITKEIWVKELLQRAIHCIFKDRPGPVLVDLPDDIQRADINA